MDFVLGDFNGLNVMFQSNEFKFQGFRPEVECIIRMFCANFMVISQNRHLSAIIDGKASLDSASVLARSRPQLADKTLQVIDRQWRSIFIDEEVLRNGQGTK